jgi:hypothetical protein
LAEQIVDLRAWWPEARGRDRRFGGIYGAV